LGEPTDLIIFAAHQDDCVILAGEYAIWASNVGKKIEIIYLTCGADDPSSVRARERKSEAITSWRQIGLQKSDIYFLDYPQTPLGEQCKLNSMQIMKATNDILTIINHSNIGTAVFLPAEGESHSDHEMIRMIGIHALQIANRNDLIVFEAPEYNSYYSFSGSPQKVLNYITKMTPIFSNFFPKYKQVFQGFINPSKRYYIMSSICISRKKLDILRGFVSENPDILESYFGGRNEFRPFEKKSCGKYMYITVGDRKLSLLVVLFWCWLYFFLALISCLLGEILRAWAFGYVFVLFIVFVCSWKIVRNKHAIETILVYLSVGIPILLQFIIKFF
jgi:LmbE family N-acetylglucosaminyl deacetylase